MKKLSTREIVSTLGEMWENNNFDGYVSLFTKDALVSHPYFSQPVKVAVAMEVINAPVQGYTNIVGYEQVLGNGNGEDDIVRVKFQETGDQIDEDVKYIGSMIVYVYIRDHVIYKIDTKGVEIELLQKSTEDINYRTIDYGDLTSKEVAEKLAETWECNNINEFVSLFSDDAKIKHVVLDKEEAPQVIAEVMNCNAKGITRLSDYALLKGDGSGEDDVIELTFDETGTEMGYKPSNIGKIMVSATVKKHRISYLKIYGYKISNSLR
ncbi:MULTISPECIES: hypothetical protein [Clostridium]|uniref:SnoaL-like domain-containing protein n=1 Tax=Clostridium botulinum TaxID=1491 RepID=A0ABD7CFM9_CLOBO|nr:MULTISPECIES: hypothetical protein [Clostridium]KGO15598.1 hypothetical protein NZ45_00940 [Clostridium botulinum]KOY66152.1 hypothetical protein AN649_10115 [Clostridium sporogenes]MDS1006406.1 hypothetical protein [Clostridium sporogenes]QRI51998.1 hypothetical protein JQS73_11090 [Clostridium botulinum]